MKALLKLLTIIIVIGFNSCEKPNDTFIEKETNNSIPHPEAIFPQKMKTTQKLIAKIQKNGHEFSFLKVGNISENNILITEKLYGELEAKKDLSVFKINDNSTPFSIFINHTDKNIAIPLEIAQTVNQQVLNKFNRKIASYATSLELLDKNDPDHFIKTACTDIGDEMFLKEYCNKSLTSLPNDILHCDSLTSRLVGRSSIYEDQWNEFSNTILVTNVVCGVTRIQFYGWDGFGAWQLEAEVDYPDGIYKSQYMTSIKTERHVLRSHPEKDGGAFRSHTRFINTNIE